MPVPDRQDPLTVSANLFDITSDLAGVFWQPSRMASCYIRIGTALQMRKRVIRHAMLETLLRGF